MATRVQEVLGNDGFAVVTDQGYYDGPQVKACLEQNIIPSIPKPQTSANKKQGLFTKVDFRYDRTRDSYWCPGDAELTYRFQTVEHGREVKYYATPACSSCSIKSQCTRNKDGRRITRWVEEDLLDDMAERVRENPQIMRRRKEIVEHPFGTGYPLGAAHDGSGLFLAPGVTQSGRGDEFDRVSLQYQARDHASGRAGNDRCGGSQ